MAVVLEKLDEKLLKWVQDHNRLSGKEEYIDWGPNHIPCCNDCGKAITIGDDVFVVYNRKGKVKAVFCSKLCNRQYLLDVRVRQIKERDL
jgi:uncharacterized protein YuzE